MNKTCNLDTVKNTPSEARRDTGAEYYYIEAFQPSDIDSNIQYQSVQCIIDMIYDILGYSDLSILDNAVVYGCYSDGIVQPLFMFKNDVVGHDFRVIKLNQ